MLCCICQFHLGTFLTSSQPLVIISATSAAAIEPGGFYDQLEEAI
jgi:hypothetical protein